MLAAVALTSCSDGDPSPATAAPTVATTDTTTDTTDMTDTTDTTTDTTDTSTSGAADDGADAALDFPDVLAVEASRGDDGRWSFAVTISSPYDTPDQYADGWRVVGPDGTVYGEHTLAHDHASEQPFTRRQSGVEIPVDVSEVTIEGRDLLNGFGGATRTVTLDDG